MDKIGDKVTVLSYGNHYTGTIIGMGRKYPKVRFKYRNGRVRECAAFIVNAERTDPLDGVGYRIPNTYPKGTVLCLRRHRVPCSLIPKELP